MVYFNGRSRKEGRSRNYDREGWLGIQAFANERPKTTNPYRTPHCNENPTYVFLLWE
jgi:hypothetical protein